MYECQNANKTYFRTIAEPCNVVVGGAGLRQWTDANWVTRARSPFTCTLNINTLRDILCYGLADLFTSWFIFIVVICHWPDGLDSEAHVINHAGHYCLIITLSLSESAASPACFLSAVSTTQIQTVRMQSAAKNAQPNSTGEARNTAVSVCIQRTVRDVWYSDIMIYYYSTVSVFFVITSVQRDWMSRFRRPTWAVLSFEGVCNLSEDLTIIETANTPGNKWVWAGGLNLLQCWGGISGNAL